jgi:hypothetical protein
VEVDLKVAKQEVDLEERVAVERVDMAPAAAVVVVVESRMVAALLVDLEVAALLELLSQKLHIGMKFFNLTFSSI